MVSRTEKNKTKRNKIKKEENSKKRKAFIVNFLKVIFAITIIIFCICSYIYYESTSILEVREYSNVYSNLPQSFHGFKIVQFGDLYYDKNYKQILKSIKNTIDKINPNVIVFTGGLIHKNYNLTDLEKEKLIDFLNDLKCDIGKFFVASNKDDTDVVNMLTNSGFTFLDDKEELIYYDGSTPIILYGINEKNSITYSNKELFKIVATHDPETIDNLLKNDAPDIIMSGKSLNGQLRIPYGGGLVFSKRYKYYDKYYKSGNTDIYITGGIGTNNIPVRTFNHPSINLYRLRTKKENHTWFYFTFKR